jgi:hypothetical protein
MAYLYSTQFGGGIVSPDEVSFFPVVPDGYIWVVRAIDLVPLDSEGGQISVVETTLPCYLFTVGTAVAGQSYQWRGHQVFNAGQSLAVFNGISTWSFVMSGYQLTSP